MIVTAALGLVLAQPQASPETTLKASPETTLKVLTGANEFIREQGDPTHAIDTAELCRVKLEEVEKTGQTLFAVLAEESQKRGWNSAQYSAMVHDCFIYSVGRANGAAEQTVKESITK